MPLLIKVTASALCITCWPLKFVIIYYQWNYFLSTIYYFLLVEEVPLVRRRAKYELILIRTILVQPYQYSFSWASYQQLLLLPLYPLSYYHGCYCCQQYRTLLVLRATSTQPLVLASTHYQAGARPAQQLATPTTSYYQAVVVLLATSCFVEQASKYCKVIFLKYYFRYCMWAVVVAWQQSLVGCQSTPGHTSSSGIGTTTRSTPYSSSQWLRMTQDYLNRLYRRPILVLVQLLYYCSSYTFQTYLH